jgi:hypothetical protein
MSSVEQQQHHRNQLIEQPETTRVNGIGLWTQWTRNFKTPLLAMLDLMDNAFDAAICDKPDFQGVVHVLADTEKKTLKTVSGIVILNNSYKHIKPMAQVLEVYQSSKGDQSESIGENGVGLKQGCATLSDLSFALSKNLGQYSLGIIAKSLQRKDGCVLPSFSFTNFPQKDELRDLFTGHSVIGRCIVEYGGGSLDNGIDRLLEHYERMVTLEDRQHVFCVVLHELKHNPTSGSVVVHVDSSDDDAYQVDFAQNAKGLMAKLKQELPRQYIHTSSRLDVRVEGKPVVFAYWQKRLVELSSFQVKLDPKTPIHKSTKDWKDPVHGYSLKIYAGFDPNRVASPAKSALSLFIYSRQSGRLILQEEDARNMLGLSTGGTEYCQGLTIIVDDYHGKLPLNPTKQDLAFGEEGECCKRDYIDVSPCFCFFHSVSRTRYSQTAHGETHRANLMNWLGGISKVYWKSHLFKFQGESKTLLTDEIKGHVHTVQAFQRSHVVPRLLHECNLTTLTNITWTLRGQEKITFHGRSYQSVTGIDTLITIQETAARKIELEEKKQTPKKRKAKTSPPTSARSSKKKTQSVVNNNNDEEEVDERYSPAVARLQFEYDNETQTQMSLDSHNLKHMVSRLEERSKKYKLKAARYKEELVKKIAEVEELQQENESLRAERQAASVDNYANGERAAASHNFDDANEELAAANRKIEELQNALTSAIKKVEVAKIDAQIQQEVSKE